MTVIRRQELATTRRGKRLDGKFPPSHQMEWKIIKGIFRISNNPPITLRRKDSKTKPGIPRDNLNVTLCPDMSAQSIVYQKYHRPSLFYLKKKNQSHCYI
jgi:hypothetical protein